MHVRWESADDDKRCIACVQDLFDKTQPLASGGAYINFLTDDEMSQPMVKPMGVYGS